MCLRFSILLSWDCVHVCVCVCVCVYMCVCVCVCVCVEGWKYKITKCHVSTKLLQSLLAETLQACKDDTVESGKGKQGESWRTRDYIPTMPQAQDWGG
jgi:hypothetical protein